MITGGKAEETTKIGKIPPKAEGLAAMLYLINIE